MNKVLESYVKHLLEAELPDGYRDRNLLTKSEKNRLDAIGSAPTAGAAVALAVKGGRYGRHMGLAIALGGVAALAIQRLMDHYQFSRKTPSFRSGI